MAVMSPELRTWVVPGLAGSIAVTDADGLPRIARVWGAQVVGESDVLEVYVQRASARGLCEVLARGARTAVNLIECSRYRSRLFKGRGVLYEGTTDPTFVDESIAAMGRAFAEVGLSTDAAERMIAHADAPRAMARILLAVDSVFDQSPKKGAGSRL
jgi:hypothetical protein